MTRPWIAVGVGVLLLVGGCAGDAGEPDPEVGEVAQVIGEPVDAVEPSDDVISPDTVTAKETPTGEPSETGSPSPLSTPIPTPPKNPVPPEIPPEALIMTPAGAVAAAKFYFDEVHRYVVFTGDQSQWSQVCPRGRDACDMMSTLFQEQQDAGEYMVAGDVEWDAAPFEDSVVYERGVVVHIRGEFAPDVAYPKDRDPITVAPRRVVELDVVLGVSGELWTIHDFSTRDATGES